MNKPIYKNGTILKYSRQPNVYTKSSNIRIVRDYTVTLDPSDGGTYTLEVFSLSFPSKTFLRMSKSSVDLFYIDLSSKLARLFYL